MSGSSDLSATAGTFALGGDLVVNRLGFGSFRLTGPGGWGTRGDPDESVRVLRRAVELGVNFIDTADSYGPMVAEQLIRIALHPYSDDLVIATKVGQARPGPGEWVPLGRPEYLRQQTELSLRNLGLERIDLLLLHRIDPKVPLSDQVGTLRLLQEQGKVRHIGLSEVSIMKVEEAEKIARIVCVQNLFNVADRSAEPLLEYTVHRGMGFIPWYPLAAGAVVLNNWPSLALPGAGRASPFQIALAWLLKRSPNILPIPGTSNLVHLEENMRAAELYLSDSDFEAVTRSGQARGMLLVQQHSVPAFDAARLTDHVGEARVKEFRACLCRAAAILRGRRLVNVTGDDQRKGGVYEIMRTTLPYLRGAGIDVVWVDLRTQPAARPALEFFHVLAHGRAPSADWRGDLPSRAVEFAEFCRVAGAELKSFLRATDVVLLHDTQCAPVPGELGAWRDRVIWHAHIGTPDRNELVDNYWRVVGPGVSAARACVFYRPEYAPPELRGQSVFAAPGVDPSSRKSAPLSRDDARAALAGMPRGRPLRWVSGAGPATGSGSGSGSDRVIAVQLSRWDPLKDMPGAFRVFARTAEQDPSFTGMVVGPSAQSAAERRQLQLCVDEHQAASPAARSRVHIGVIEQCGTDEHDQTVRVLQSAADIVLQKSVQEGFGLTVTEAMLRGKPVLASAVGGIPLQLRHGYNGMLLRQGSDDEAWASRLHALVSDAELRSRLGTRARADVLDRHTVDREVSTVINDVSKLIAAAR